MITREQLEACPRFSEHGLTEGCGLCDPSKVPLLKTDVEEALAPVAGRHEAEQLRLANDATLQRIVARGFQIGKGDILQLYLSVLLDHLLGDFDDPRRQAYEIAVHTKMAEVLAEAETAINRQALLQGVVQMPPVNPHPHGPMNGRRRRG